MDEKKQTSNSDDDHIFEIEQESINNYSLSNFDNILLGWDFYEDIKEEEPSIKKTDSVFSFNIKGEKCEVTKNPTKFGTVKEYLEYFFPLFLLECQQSIQRAKQIEMSEYESFTLSEIKLNNSLIEDSNLFTLTFDKKSSDENFYFSPQDLVLITFDSKSINSDLNSGISNENNIKHMLGVVQGSNSNGKLFVNTLNPAYYLDEKSVKRNLSTFSKTERWVSRLKYFQEFLNENNDNLDNFEPKIWYLFRITSFATNYRELSGLFSLPELLLKDDLLCKNIRFDQFMRIPTLLNEKLESIYNHSQMNALKECLKFKGISLIQGPPGTGKTTTIIGIISALLSSTIDNSKKDNDMLDGIDNIQFKKRKVSEDKEKEYFAQMIRTKPWCYDNDYVPWYDIEMRDLKTSCFNKIEAKKVTLNTSNKKIGPRKLLICAPSNAAIDAIVRKLIYNPLTEEGGILDHTGNYYSPTIIRAGPNFHPDLQEYSLEFRLKQRLLRNGFDIKNCRQEIKQRTQWKILQESQIVCATLSVCGSKELISILNNNNRKSISGLEKDQLSFDTVIIDEASQGVELSTLIPLKLGCRRLILVGDPKQLPATVLSRRAIEYKYDVSLFQRLQMSGFPVVMLSVQYRMHPQISAFPSKHFYDGELQDYSEILKTRTPIIPWEDIPIFKPFTFFSVNSEEDQGKSISNPIEADFVCQILELLGLVLFECQRKHKEGAKDNIDHSKISNISSNYKWYEHIAVISPYNEQVKLIRKKIKEKFNLTSDIACPIDVSTVDGFQGQEKDYIIFSVVRSQYIEDDSIEDRNSRKTNAGFIADRRRINVALTRAKHNLWIVGNSRYLLGNPEWRSLWDYSCKSNSQFSVDFKRIGSDKNYLKLWLYNYLQRKENIRNTLRLFIPEFIHNLTLDCSIIEKNKEISNLEIKTSINSHFFDELKEDKQNYEPKKKIYKLLSKNKFLNNELLEKEIKRIDLDLYCDLNDYEFVNREECETEAENND